MMNALHHQREMAQATNCCFQFLCCGRPIIDKVLDVLCPCNVLVLGKGITKAAEIKNSPKII
jgi:hypothetical protein